jgi:TolB-like protein
MVTPFSNNTTVDSQDMPVAGLSSLIAEELRETYSLRVSQYRTDASDATPAREYIVATPSVRYVLDGTASFSSTLDIAVHLNNRTGVSLWSDRYARPRGDVMDMVADIAIHVSRALASDGGVFGTGQHRATIRNRHRANCWRWPRSCGAIYLKPRSRRSSRS